MQSDSVDLEIDGAIGGGSVLRVAVPIAIALNKSIKITNIRATRSKPGLRLQHLAGLELLAKISNSILHGGKIGSSEIILFPKKNGTQSEVEYPNLKLNTAASVSLIIQAVANYVFASRKSAIFSFQGGGTHTNWSPNFDYLEKITKPLYDIFGVHLDMDVKRFGFYPKGGARGKVTLSSSPLSQLQLSSSGLQQIEIISIASTSLKKAKVAERQIDGILSSNVIINSKSIEYIDTSNPGTSCTAILRFSNSTVKGTSTLGKKGIPAESIGKQTAEKIIKELQNAVSVDNFMADQLIVPLAFAPLHSSYSISEITPHVRANLEVISQILGIRISVEKKENIIILKRI